MNKYDLVYTLVSSIPKGKVSTYGRIADLAGLSNPRHVGSILHKNPDGDSIPCHRVVNAKGELSGNFAFGGRDGQEGRLRAEGVTVKNGKLNLACYLWNPS